MKKTFLLILSFIILILLVSCTSQSPSSQSKQAFPKGEYGLTISGEIDLLYEQPKKSYKAGETIVVRTHLVCDADVVAELNGADAISQELIQDENGHYICTEWKFIMPEKSSELRVYTNPGMDAIYRKLEIIDPEGIIVNTASLVGMKSRGEQYEIHTKTPSVEIQLNREIVNLDYLCVANEKGEVLYYKWIFEMPDEDVQIRIRYDFYEPYLCHLTFVEKTGKHDLFDDYTDEYAPGEKIKIVAKDLLEDAEILIKANGKKIEPKVLGEWEYIMPNGEVTLEAYIINCSFGENWHYLNIEDPYNLLDGVYDRYYVEGNTIILRSREYELKITAKKDDGTILGMNYSENLSSEIFEYRFVMPNDNITLIVDYLPDTFDD